MTAVDERPAVFADFNQIDDLLERAMVLEIVVHAGYLGRGALDRQSHAFIDAAVELWREKILPFEECATPARYLSETYTDDFDGSLLHHRLMVAAGVVVAACGRPELLPALHRRLDRMGHPSDADLLAEVLLCESAGGAL